MKGQSKVWAAMDACSAVVVCEEKEQPEVIIKNKNELEKKTEVEKLVS